MELIERAVVAESFEGCESPPPFPPHDAPKYGPCTLLANAPRAQTKRKKCAAWAWARSSATSRASCA